MVLGMQSTAITATPSLNLLTIDYCHPDALYRDCCLHQDMIRLACSDTHFNSLYRLYIMMLAMGPDVLFILLSCAVIPRTVLAIASARERLKALNTCVPTSWLCSALCSFSEPVHCAQIWTAHLTPGAHPNGHSVCAFSTYDEPCYLQHKTPTDLQGHCQGNFTDKIQ